MCDIAQDFSLQQLVPEPTRGAHTLDLLLTNNPDRISKVKVVDGLPGANHDAVDFVVELARPRSSAERRIVYDFKRVDFEMFHNCLSAIPWTSYLWGVSIEDSWQRFKDLLFAAADECIPKVILQKRKKKTWLSDETLRMIHRKRRSHRVMKRSGRSGDLRQYRILSNAVRDLTRNDHCLYLEEITKDLHTSQKPFWRWLKNMRGSPRTIPDLNHQGQTLSSLAEKVKAFHAYFLSVFTKEDTRNLESLCRELEFSRSTEHVEDMSFSEDEVHNALCLIDPSKACGPDCVPGRLLKEGAPWLSEPLVAHFNLSLKTGELPSDWTSANITPVHEKGSKHCPKNYQPISLTSIVVKIMERMVHRKIMNFLSEYDKLHASQHGFRSGHSCQTQLLETVHQWANTLDGRSSSHVLFLDFSKAFDSVPHRRLLLKLDCIGVRGNLLRWIQAFLVSRRQRAVANGCSSDWAPVSSGVPQGSILGPLLFLLYVNDVGVGLESQTRLFADDCTIFRDVVGREDCKALQSDLHHLYQWSHKWQLHLNLSKCKALCISNKRMPPTYTYHLNGVSLEWVDSFTYLGVKITQAMLV